MHRTCGERISHRNLQEQASVQSFLFLYSTLLLHFSQLLIDMSISQKPNRTDLPVFNVFLPQFLIRQLHLAIHQ